MQVKSEFTVSEEPKNLMALLMVLPGAVWVIVK